jgi:hypothetical protein
MDWMQTTEVVLVDERTADSDSSSSGAVGLGLDIKWQQGPISDENPKNGTLVRDVLIVAHQRLQGYQHDPLKNRETALAITHIEEALMWLDLRTADRVGRGVQGLYSA